MRSLLVEDPVAQTAMQRKKISRECQHHSNRVLRDRFAVCATVAADSDLRPQFGVRYYVRSGERDLDEFCLPKERDLIFFYVPPEIHGKHNVGSFEEAFAFFIGCARKEINVIVSAEFLHEEIGHFLIQLLSCEEFHLTVIRFSGSCEQASYSIPRSLWTESCSTDNSYRLRFQ